MGRSYEEIVRDTNRQIDLMAEVAGVVPSRGPGHNSNEALRGYVERVERLEAEKAELSADISELYKEAKNNGFDAKVLRAVIRLRKQDVEKRKEFEAVLDTYLAALGMI